MDIEQIITKLEESKKNDFGDTGRTQYIIEKLEKRDELPKSDYLYIDRMMEMCESIVIETPQESKIIFENVLSEDLIKCNICSIEINLDEKSIRKNNFWFHTKCFEKIPILKQDVKQKVKSISPSKPPVRIIQKSTTVPQMIFSGGLLASLVGTTYLLAGEILSATLGLCGSAYVFGNIQKTNVYRKK